MAQGSYRLIATTALPRFEAERRYILTERDFADRQLEKLKGKSWPWFSYPPLGIFRRGDWQKYIRTLDAYSDQLDRHEGQFHDGLIPFRIRVTNSHPHADFDVLIHVAVENGTIRVKKKAPQRPNRMDGAADIAVKGHFRWPTLGGFARRNIHIAPHGITVEFSKLEGDDTALLVNQVIYLSCNDKTKLGFTISSRNLTEVQLGWVERAE